MPKPNSAAPDLAIYGLGYTNYPTYLEAHDWDQWAVQLTLARFFLGNVRFAIGECGLTSGVSSYFLKHCFEVWVETFGKRIPFPNGVAIKAAEQVGLPMRRVPGSPNTIIGLSERRLIRAWDRWRRLVSGEPAPPYTRYDSVDQDLDLVLCVPAVKP
jgi:hypothetical protein